MNKFKVGDHVAILSRDWRAGMIGFGVVKGIKEPYYIVTGGNLTGDKIVLESYLAHRGDTEQQKSEVNKGKIQSDGGPSGYYDFPESWNTFNDFIEHKSEKQWLGFSFHLGNIGKAICRWGDKGGTSIEYDAKKIIYSAVRVLKMIIGVNKTREYLKSLLDDEQFKGEE